MDTYLRSRLPASRWSLKNRSQQWKVAGAALLLVILWGLDPVVADILINQYTSVPGLTIVRFATFIAVALLAHFGMQRANPHRLTPISPLSTPLLASGLAMFVTTVGTYAALRSMHPTGYILLIVAGVLTLSVGRSIVRREPTAGLLIALSIVIASFVLYLTYSKPSTFGVGAALLGSLGFAGYSVASQQYQKAVSIRTRYPTFLLWVAVTALACSLFLLPWTPLRGLTGTTLIFSILFVLIFTVLPYILYFEIMRLTESRLLDRLLPLVIISTVLGDLALHQNAFALWGLPALVGVAWLLWQHSTEQDE